MVDGKLCICLNQLPLTSSRSLLLFSDSGIMPEAQFSPIVQSGLISKPTGFTRLTGLGGLNLIILEKKNIDGKQKLHCGSVTQHTNLICTVCTVILHSESVEILPFLMSVMRAMKVFYAFMHILCCV